MKIKSSEIAIKCDPAQVNTCILQFKCYIGHIFYEMHKCSKDESVNRLQGTEINRTSKVRYLIFDLEGVTI